MWFGYGRRPCAWHYFGNVFGATLILIVFYALTIFQMKGLYAYRRIYGQFGGLCLWDASGTILRQNNKFIQYVAELAVARVGVVRFGAARLYVAAWASLVTCLAVATSAPAAYGSSITLDPVPDSAAFGEVVVLSGTLLLDGQSSEGAIVYIQDEDTLSPDDLLAIAYVDSTGRFYTYWIVEDVDFDDTIDIQAVFEGDARHGRLASPIWEMRVYDDPLAPDPSLIGGDGYMDLYYSLDLEKAPRVLIAPSPNSYDEVRMHIIPVQEGIMELTSMLEREYEDGVWDVSFEILDRGRLFASEEPDIIISIVTDKEDPKCGVDYSGVAWPDNTQKPIQAKVCSLEDLTRDDVSGTAAHEFIHAIGVGHTFNIAGDMMCSVEDDIPTCGGSGPKSNTPSDLNLAAIVAAYGTDGFQNPNNGVTYGERFTSDHYYGQSHRWPSTDPDQSPATVYTGEIYTDQARYTPGGVILVDGFYWESYNGPSNIVIVGPYGSVVDELQVIVVDDFFTTIAAGYHLPGDYTAYLYDNSGGLVTSTEFYVVDGATESIYDAYTYTDHYSYYPGENILIDGFYLGSYEGPSEITVVDPEGYVVDEIYVEVVGDFFDTVTWGHYLPGSYAVWLHDDAGEFVSSTAFHVMDVSGLDATSIYSGWAYTEFVEYVPGETVIAEGSYRDAHYGPSVVVVLNPEGYLEKEVSIILTGPQFSADLGEYYQFGTYTILLYDHLGDLVSSSAFRIVDTYAENLYTGLVFTDYDFYHPGETVLIDGFYLGPYDGQSKITVVDPEGYVVDEIYVEVAGDFFDTVTWGHYLPGSYAVWLHDDAGEFVSSTAFHVVGEDDLG